jgi:hypothetical protein
MMGKELRWMEGSAVGVSVEITRGMLSYKYNVCQAISWGLLVVYYVAGSVSA